MLPFQSRAQHYGIGSMDNGKHHTRNADNTLSTILSLSIMFVRLNHAEEERRNDDAGICLLRYK